MKVSIVDDPSEFDRLGEIWNKVLSTSAVNYPFISFEWLSSFWKNYGKGGNLLIVTTSELPDAPPSCIAPFMIAKKAPFHVLQFIGTGLSDYLDIFGNGNLTNSISEIFSRLNSEKGWDLIFLSDVLFDEGNAQDLMDAAKAVGWKTDHRLYTISPYLPIEGDWQQFLDSKSSNFRYTLKRREKRLQKEGLKLDIRFVASDMLNQQIINDMTMIETNSWKFDAGSAKMQKKHDKSFYQDFLMSFARNNWLNIWIGYLNDKPVAYLINFDFGGKIWFYNGAYDHSAEHYSIGSILTHYAVKDAFIRNKKEYDFLRGEEAYKSHWASRSRETFQIVFYKPTLYSFLGYILIFKLRWFLAKYQKLQDIRLSLKRLLHSVYNS